MIVKFEIDDKMNAMYFVVDGKRQNYLFLADSHIDNYEIVKEKQVGNCTIPHKITVNYHLHSVVQPNKMQTATVTLRIV